MPEQVSFAAAMPRDAAPGLTLACGVIPGFLAYWEERVGERSDQHTGRLVKRPGCECNGTGAVYDAPNRTVVAMECAYSAT